MTNRDKFPSSKIYLIREKLLALDESKLQILLHYSSFKDPTLALILSIFLGIWGIDRFYIGDVGLGVGKLLTGGLCGVWAFIDWFFIMEATKEKNFQQLMMML